MNESADAHAPQTVAIVSTYPPRRCGIGTFAGDLTTALDRVPPETDAWVVAVNDRLEGYRYPHRVKFEINEGRPREYRLAADFLNMSQVRVACVQHEYGIYGGPAGKHVLELIRRLRMPVVTTLHTVLEDPDPDQLAATEALAAESDRLVVLSDTARRILLDRYGVTEDQVAVIPHGIPDVPFADPQYHKDRFGVAGKHVLMTFGLLSPNKGIEHMIDAMPRIVEKHPETVYIVLGATHPGVVAEHGEEYRTELQRRAERLGVREHVIFINRFLNQQELIDHLGAADVYVTPYLNEAQVVSGTLAYALGAGKAVVSTPYWYAEEMLAEDRGRLVPFGDTEAIAETINELLENDDLRLALRKKAYDDTRPMVWDRVAARYLELFQTVAAEQASSPRPRGTAVPDLEKRPELAEVKLDHLKRLTDDVGMLQHAVATVPDRAHGYCTDDNARALIALVLAQDHADEPAGSLESLATRYLAFLQHAYTEEVDPPGFRNFMGYDRCWLEPIGSGASQARAVWALGVTVGRSSWHGHVRPAAELFRRALPRIEAQDDPRGWSFALVGIHAYLQRFSGETEVRRARERLGWRLQETLEGQMSEDWPWFEDVLTWGNARVPQALLLCGEWLFESKMVETALHVLDWLTRVQTDPETGHFTPVGCDGWYPRYGEKARFDQQPLEAAAMIDACLEAHRHTREDRWLRTADRCLNWYLGDNDLRVPLYDPHTGGCYDGLEPQGVNVNQGAESTLAWLLALLSMYDHNHPTAATMARAAGRGGSARSAQPSR